MTKPLILIIASLLAGCASVTPHYDARFGDAVREAKLKMIITPEAGRNADGVLGMDGRAAKETIGVYQETFKTPPRAVNVINIGGAVGSAAR